MAGHGVAAAEGGGAGDFAPELGDARGPYDVLGGQLHQDLV
jgi:hypothetical protein